MLQKIFYFIAIFIIVLFLHIFLFNNFYTKENKKIKKLNKPFLAKIILIKNEVKKTNIDTSEAKKVVLLKSKDIIQKSNQFKKQKVDIVKKEKKVRVKQKIEEKKVVKKQLIKKEKKFKNHIVKTIKSKDKVKHEASNRILIKKKKKDTLLEKQLLENYIEYIKETILKNKFYPKIAKRMGIEGSCSLKLNILHNGQIKNLELKKKSDFSVLNKASLEIINKIQKFKEFPTLLEMKEINIIVPIRYRLEG